ncbi:MAG: DUF86 domain-containing protein [Erysipelotrichaceae bacterium]|nr:DUF86 domain-containing protein [Erysipelotrichaceae bacterium]
MNEKTKVMYNLARMYEYVRDIDDLCEKNNYDIDRILSNKINRYAINMCIVQIGEHAKRIKAFDMQLYYDQNLSFYQIKGMRDRITHSYGEIDYSIVKDVLQTGIPGLKIYLENELPMELLQNPYALYEEEYEDVLERLEKEEELEMY